MAESPTQPWSSLSCFEAAHSIQVSKYKFSILFGLINYIILSFEVKWFKEINVTKYTTLLHMDTDARIEIKTIILQTYMHVIAPLAIIQMSIFSNVDFFNVENYYSEHANIKH